MAQTVFYSWQSDSPGKENRNFIEDALKRALKKIKREASVLVSPRPEDLEVDRDTKGKPGSPVIAETILQKIDECAVFVPDLTFVASTPKGRPTPNPNVLIEYGYALKSRGDSYIVCVMNAAYGEPSWEALPFNFRHRRWPITYDLPSGSDTKKRSQERKRLVESMSRAILDVIRTANISDVVTFAETRPTYDASVFFDQREPLASREAVRGPAQEISLTDRGQKMFLRLVPTAPTEIVSSKQAFDIASRQHSRLMPFNWRRTTGGEMYDRNRYGAIVYRENNDKGIECFTQLLKNRELWGVSTEPSRWRDQQEGNILPNGYEDAFSRALGHYLEFAREHLKLLLPLRFIVGFTGVTGFRIAMPYGFCIDGYKKIGGKVVEPDIIIEGSVGDWEQPPDDILMPFFEHIWHEFGFDERPDAPN